VVPRLAPAMQADHAPERLTHHPTVPVGRISEQEQAGTP
jgi:hypothetical protein